MAASESDVFCIVASKLHAKIKILLNFLKAKTRNEKAFLSFVLFHGNYWCSLMFRSYSCDFEE